MADKFMLHPDNGKFLLADNGKFGVAEDCCCEADECGCSPALPTQMSVTISGVLARCWAYGSRSYQVISTSVWPNGTFTLSASSQCQFAYDTAVTGIIREYSDRHCTTFAGDHPIVSFGVYAYISRRDHENHIDPDGFLQVRVDVGYASTAPGDGAFYRYYLSSSPESCSAAEDKIYNNDCSGIFYNGTATIAFL